MKLTEYQIKHCNDISTGQIIIDIADTQKEIDAYKIELKALMSNPVDNKLDIYMRKGKVLQREEFIDKLNQILEYRNQLNNNKE
jgi:hypothetical protein